MEQELAFAPRQMASAEVLTCGHRSPPISRQSLLGEISLLLYQPLSALQIFEEGVVCATAADHGFEEKSRMINMNETQNLFFIHLDSTI